MRLRLLLPRGGGRAELRRVGLSAARDLDWDGCVNARDLGGLPTLDGRVTRRGALIRSEAVDRLTRQGWRALREYGVRTIIDLREEDELSEPGGGRERRDGIETLHIPLDRIAEDREFWDDWMHGPQFGTPLYYAPFVERFPERIDEVLDAIEQARPGGVLFHCAGGRDRTGLVAIAALAAARVEPEAIADDYSRGAERAHTHDPVLKRYIAEQGTSSRELVLELAARLELDRPALRTRLLV